MARKLHSDDELRRTFDDEPELEGLFNDLQTVDGTSVEVSGEGRSVYKVFLADRTGRYEAFLWVYCKFAGYVQWAHQGDYTEICRQVWRASVKDASNPDGSDLQSGIGRASLLRLIKAYAREVSLKA